MDYAGLKAWDAAATGTDDARLAALNAATISVNQPVPISDVLIWVASIGLLTKIQAHAANSADPLQNAAAAALLMFQGNYTVFDVTTSKIQGMIAGFVAAGDLTSAQEAQLFALNATLVSPGQQLGWTGPVTLGDLQLARTL